METKVIYHIDILVITRKGGSDVIMLIAFWVVMCITDL